MLQNDAEYDHEQTVSDKMDTETYWAWQTKMRTILHKGASCQRHKSPKIVTLLSSAKN